MRHCNGVPGSLSDSRYWRVRDRQTDRHACYLERHSAAGGAVMTPSTCNRSIGSCASTCMCTHHSTDSSSSVCFCLYPAVTLRLAYTTDLLRPASRPVNGCQ